MDVQRPGGQDIVDFMYRCRPRLELDRLLGVPEERPQETGPPHLPKVHLLGQGFVDSLDNHMAKACRHAYV